MHIEEARSSPAYIIMYSADAVRFSLPNHQWFLLWLKQGDSEEKKLRFND